MRLTGWVVNAGHHLDEETGDLPDGLPTPVLNLALFFGSIVAWVTDHLADGDEHTNVPVGEARVADAVWATRRRIGSRFGTHRLAVPAQRRQRPDPRLGGDDVEPSRRWRRARSTERHTADNKTLTQPRQASHDASHVSMAAPSRHGSARRKARGGLRGSMRSSLNPPREPRR